LVVLGKLMMALAIGAGVGLLVGGGTANFASNSALSDFSVVLGCGVGLIVFGGTAYGWLLGEQQQSPKGMRAVQASARETPISRRELPQETGPWQPPAEHAC
jgi:hypothetical protein